MNKQFNGDTLSLTSTGNGYTVYYVHSVSVTKNRPSQIIPLYFNPRSRMGNDHCSLTYSTNANFTNSVLVHVTLNLLVVD